MSDERRESRERGIIFPLAGNISHPAGTSPNEPFDKPQSFDSVPIWLTKPHPVPPGTIC